MNDFRLMVLKRIGHVEKLEYKAFVALYSGSQNKRYQRAVDSLAIAPVTDSDAHIDAFIKAEKVFSTESVTVTTTTESFVVEGKEDAAPRGISPRSPRYNVELGRYLRPLEHVIYKVIGKIFGGKTISKGRNAVEQAQDLKHCMDSFGDPVAVGLDASRFDQHVSMEALRFEHEFYMGVFPNDKFLKWLLKLQLNNKITFLVRNGKVKIKIKGKRMSGDMNTGLGNCILMCAMIWSYARDTNIRVRLYNNGDDCVVVMERRDVEKFSAGLREWFLRYGFNMKVEKPVDDFEQIEFCQTKPVWNGKEYVMCRKYPICIEKDQVSLLPIDSEKAMLNYFIDLGNCGQALASGIPILSEFYAMFQRWGAGAKGFNKDHKLYTGMEHLAVRMTGEYNQITNRARHSFFIAFGVTPMEQRSWELRYARAERPSFNPVVQHRLTRPIQFYQLP
nr:MAG: RNA-dependent RNA polymerase [Crogonang virus 51]